MIRAASTSEMLVNFYQVTWHNNPEGKPSSSYRLVTTVKLIYTSVQVSNIFVCAVCFKLINFVFQIFPFLVLECSSVHCSLLSVFMWPGFCNQFNLASVIFSDNFEHTLSKGGL
jgi:hypothetical protein